MSTTKIIWIIIICMNQVILLAIKMFKCGNSTPVWDHFWGICSSIGQFDSDEGDRIWVWRATNIAFWLPRHSQMQPFPTKMFSKFPKILNFKDESMILKALKPIVSSYYEWWGITQSVFGFIFYFLLFYWFEVGGALLVKGENTNCLNFLTLIVAYSIMNTSCLLKNI